MQTKAFVVSAPHVPVRPGPQAALFSSQLRRLHLFGVFSLSLWIAPFRHLENVCGADTHVCRLDTLVETFRGSANLSSPQGVRSVGQQMFENLKSQGLAKPEVSLGHPFSSAGMAQRAKDFENRISDLATKMPMPVYGFVFSTARRPKFGVLAQRNLASQRNFALPTIPRFAKNAFSSPFAPKIYRFFPGTTKSTVSLTPAAFVSPKCSST